MKHASSMVLFTEDKQSIILQLRDNVTDVHFHGCWGLIGGAAKDGESSEECMIRECLEETGWRPNNLRKILKIEEHCVESVYVSYIPSSLSLHCNEGIGLHAFNINKIDNLKISNYHKKIIDSTIDILKGIRSKTRYKVLFYTKLLPPAFGGYVVAGTNLYKAFNTVAEVTLITDDTLNKIKDNEHFDLLFFNATYENTNVFKFLSSKCVRSWTYEHNILSNNNIPEMMDRFTNSHQIFVPSIFLKDKIISSINSKYIKDINILPIPIDSGIFYFSPHKLGMCVKFITCCAIKNARNIEYTIKIINELISKYHIPCNWDIYGGVPFQGDMSYLTKLIDMVQYYGLEHIIKFKKSLVDKKDVSAVLHEADFYIDFSQHETYGQAKIEAIFAGTRVIMPSTENNKNLLDEHSIFYDGDCSNTAKQIASTIISCRLMPEQDTLYRLNARKFLLSCSIDNISNKIKELLYGIV